MSIELSTLPPLVLNQIPISLRWNKTSLVFDNLSSDLQIILRSYSSIQQPTRTPIGVYDYTSMFSRFSDLVELTSLTTLIQEYIVNWFQIKKGSYPFDFDFGTSLYSILHTKDNKYRDQLLNNEMDVLINLIRDEFATTISILNQSVVPVQFEDHTVYELQLSIRVLGGNLNLVIPG